MGRKAAAPPVPASEERPDERQATPPPPPKKKGRPSLVDLQKRALILQQEQVSPGKPSNSDPPLRRSTRRNPLPPPSPTYSSSSDEGASGRRREKKLKLVLEDGADRRSDDLRGGEKTETPNSAILTKVMGRGAQGEPSDSGPTTPLPDKKTLFSILETLQKKDKYGVYSEPVDPEELPDYHEIIDHPMDFSTVKNKLSNGAYACLEEFEKDVFLISSNAMQYNASDTIYFRQARAIQELAKKSFENLRQGDEDNEPEPEVKVVRRGRPPGKKSTKKPVVRTSAVPTTVVDSSVVATPATTSNCTSWFGSSSELLRKGSMSNILGFMSLNQAPQVHSSENCFQLVDNSFGRNEESSSGFLQRGMPMKFGKKVSISEDYRRSTYLQPLPSTCGVENPLLSTFSGEKKQLLPICVFMEHAYARSLSRFAANLGPVGWEVASKRIEKALPPGTQFGRGWVGERDSHHHNPHQTHVSSKLLSAPSAMSATCTRSNTGATAKVPDSQPSSSCDQFPSNNMQGFSIGGMQDTAAQQKDAAPTNQDSLMPHLQKMNGFNKFYFDLSQVGNMQIPVPRDLHAEVPMTHGQLLDMVSRTNKVELPPAAASHMEAVRTCSGNAISISNSHQSVYAAPDAQTWSLGNPPGMNMSGVDARHPAMRIPELQRVNFSHACSVNSSCSILHPSLIGNSDGRIFSNQGMMKHGSSVHSGLGNNTAAKASAPEDLHTIPSRIDGDPVSTNMETNYERDATTGNNIINVNQSSEKQNPTHSGKTLPDSAQNFFREPSIPHSKGDSMCPDLNSVFQTAG